MVSLSRGSPGSAEVPPLCRGPRLHHRDGRGQKIPELLLTGQFLCHMVIYSLKLSFTPFIKIYDTVLLNAVERFDSFMGLPDFWW